MTDQFGRATSKIVSAFAMTHTPGLSDRLDEAPPGQVASILHALQAVRRQLEDARPQVLIALINDHFDMFCLRNSPTFAIGVADHHYGPSEHLEEWIQLKRSAHRGAPQYAKAILADALRAGFDLTRVASCELNHNVMLPRKYLWPTLDLPIVPVFINCFCRPLPSWRRCYDLGRVIRRTVEARPERVAIFASGGISHWPPFVDEDDAIGSDDPLARRILHWQTEGRAALVDDPQVSRDLLAKEKELASSGRDLINTSWDRRLLQAMNDGDHEFLVGLDEESILKDGGSGGYEMAMWVCLMGVLDSAPCRTLVYEPVREWMGGVAVVAYTERTATESRHGPSRQPDTERHDARDRAPDAVTEEH